MTDFCAVTGIVLNVPVALYQLSYKIFTLRKKEEDPHGDKHRPRTWKCCPLAEIYTVRTSQSVMKMTCQSHWQVIFNPGILHRGKKSLRFRKVVKRKKENPFGIRSVVLEFLAQKSKSLFMKWKKIFRVKKIWNNLDFKVKYYYEIIKASVADE